MKLEIRKRSEALEDLTNHYAYIARDSIASAEHFLSAANATFEQLATLPEIGSPRDYGKGELVGVRMVRIPAFPRHLVFYRITPEAVEVLRVLHSSRDIQAVFDEE